MRYRPAASRLASALDSPMSPPRRRGGDERPKILVLREGEPEDGAFGSGRPGPPRPRQPAPEIFPTDPPGFSVECPAAGRVEFPRPATAPVPQRLATVDTDRGRIGLHRATGGARNFARGNSRCGDASRRPWPLLGHFLRFPPSGPGRPARRPHFQTAPARLRQNPFPRVSPQFNSKHTL